MPPSVFKPREGAGLGADAAMPGPSSSSSSWTPLFSSGDRVICPATSAYPAGTVGVVVGCRREAGTVTRVLVTVKVRVEGPGEEELVYQADFPPAALSRVL